MRGPHRSLRILINSPLGYVPAGMKNFIMESKNVMLLWIIAALWA
jgi:hypothetical protein